MDKLKTGVKGLDAILDGGYPRGRPTLLKAAPGCGKTIFCQLFTSQCVTEKYNVCFVTCDESPSMLIENMDKLGLQGSVAEKSGKLRLLDFRPSLNDTVVGEFEFNALLLRIQNNLKGKHPVLIVDSLRNLFIGLDSEKTELALLDLCNWARENRVTLLFTTPESISSTASAFEEYATDCVIRIKQTMHSKLMTRFLHVEKYRGTSHGTNEYPFLIHKKGISIFPITEALFSSNTSRKRLSTGITSLDEMIGGGYFEASSVLISGTSGTAKSMLASKIAYAAVLQKQKVIYFTYEESLSDFMFNTKSVGMNFQDVVDKKQVVLKTVRAVEKGLEEHLIEIFEAVEAVKPHLVIIDPITSLLDLGTSLEVKAFLVRLISYLKHTQKITTLFVEFLNEISNIQSEVGILSLIDTAIKLERVQSNGELNRLIQVRKSRGSHISNQIKEFIITDQGFSIQSPYIGNGEIVVGSAKQQKMLLDKQCKLSLKGQLDGVNAQLNRLEKYNSDALSREEIQAENLKYSLLDKKRVLENELENMIAMEAMNKKSREG